MRSLLFIAVIFIAPTLLQVLVIAATLMTGRDKHD